MGLEGPEYLAWLGDQPEADYTNLMGANTYRLMSDLAAGGEPGTEALADLPTIVFEHLDGAAVVFPVITGSSGKDRIYDGYPDVSLEMVSSRLFDGRLQLLEYVPTVLARPPLAAGESTSS